MAIRSCQRSSPRQIRCKPTLTANLLARRIACRYYRIKKMTKQDLIELLPVLILGIPGIYSIAEVFSTDYIFGYQQYIGLTLLGVSIILFFVNRRLYKYFFGITLILATVNLIGFTTTIRTIYFFGIEFQYLPLIVLIIFTIIYRESIQPKIKEWVGNSEKQLASERRAKINGFKQRFNKLTDDQIEKMQDEELVPEAIEALNQIKNERKNAI